MEELFNRIQECPKCIIHTPPSSYYFFPSKNDEYQYLNNNNQNPIKLIRYIFEKKNKSNYKSFENEIYEKFFNFLKSKKILLPHNWRESDTRRFLQSTYFDIEKTLEKIIQYIKFEIPKLPFNSYKQILSSRFLYMHGLDINYCPILVANGKIFMEINNKPLIWHVVNRLTYTELIDDIIVATTTDKKDDATEEWCKKNEINCYRGSEDDVLNRFYSAATAFPCDVIVRVTADDPFKEPKIIDMIIKKLMDENLDLSCNVFPPSFPEGLDCEVFTFNVLETMEKTTNDPYDREHVTPYIYNNPDKFKIGNVTSSHQLSQFRWTIDNQEDYEMINTIYEKRTNEEEILLMEEILKILEENPEIAEINSNVKRSGMYQK